MSGRYDRPGSDTGSVSILPAVEFGSSKTLLPEVAWRHTNSDQCPIAVMAKDVRMDAPISVTWLELSALIQASKLRGSTSDVIQMNVPVGRH